MYDLSNNVINSVSFTNTQVAANEVNVLSNFGDLDNGNYILKVFLDDDEIALQNITYSKLEGTSIRNDEYTNHFVFYSTIYDFFDDKKDNELILDSTSSDAMRLNTLKLQAAIDEVSNNGGGIVEIPSGTFYFSYGGSAYRTGNTSYSEKYVIRPRNNVTLIGQGISGEDATILKPYNSSTSEFGIDI